MSLTGFLRRLRGRHCKNFRILLIRILKVAWMICLPSIPTCPSNVSCCPRRAFQLLEMYCWNKRTQDIIVFPDDDCWYASTLSNGCVKCCRISYLRGFAGVWTPSPDIYASGLPEGLVSRTGLFQLAGTCVRFTAREAVTGIRFDPLLGPGTGLPYGCGEDTDYFLYVHDRTRCEAICKDTGLSSFTKRKPAFSRKDGKLCSWPACIC